MRPCTVCIHPKRDEIDAAILDERPYRSIAAHFGMSHLAVYRHKLNHLPDSYTRDSVRRIREDFEDYSNEILSLFVTVQVPPPIFLDKSPVIRYRMVDECAASRSAGERFAVGDRTASPRVG